MRLFNRKGLVARRAYRASLPPTLIGLVTFSFVLVAFGGTVYAAAVPALIVQNPVVQTVSQAVGSSELFSSGVSEDDSSSDTHAVSSATSDSGASSGSANGMGISFSPVTPLPSSPSAPVVDDPGESLPEGGSTSEDNAGDVSQDEGGAEQNPPVGGAPGNGQNGIPIQPLPPDENHQAEDEAFRMQLRAYYDGLAGHANAINELFLQFNTQCLNPDGDIRYQCFSDVHREFNALSGISSELNSTTAPSGSAYAAAFEDIKVLYNDLGSAMAVLRRAWMINIEMSDPSLYVDDFMAPIREKTGPDGKITYLSDFEKRYPGARP